MALTFRHHGRRFEFQGIGRGDYKYKWVMKMQRKDRAGRGTERGRRNMKYLRCFELTVERAALGFNEEAAVP